MRMPQVVICISGPYMIDTLFPPSIADFYEKKLAAKGVMFARNVRFKSASSCPPTRFHPSACLIDHASPTSYP